MYLLVIVMVIGVIPVMYFEDKIWDLRINGKISRSEESTLEIITFAASILWAIFISCVIEYWDMVN